MTEPIKSSLDTLLDPESGEWDKQLQEASPEEVKELYYGEASTLDKLSYGFQKQASLLGMGLSAIEAGLNKDKTFSEVGQEKKQQIEKKFGWMHPTDKDSLAASAGGIGKSFIDPVFAGPLTLPSAIARAGSFMALNGLDAAGNDLIEQGSINPKNVAIASSFGALGYFTPHIKLGKKSLDEIDKTGEKIPDELSDSLLDSHMSMSEIKSADDLEKLLDQRFPLNQNDPRSSLKRSLARKNLKAILPSSITDKEAKAIKNATIEVNNERKSMFDSTLDLTDNAVKITAATNASRNYINAVKKVKAKEADAPSKEELKLLKQEATKARKFLHETLPSRLVEQSEVLSEGVMGIAGRLHNTGDLNKNTLTRIMTRPLVGMMGGYGIGVTNEWVDPDSELDPWMFMLSGMFVGQMSKKINAATFLPREIKDQANSITSDILKNNLRKQANLLFAGTQAARANVMGGFTAILGKTLFSQRGSDLAGAARTSLEETKDIVLQDLSKRINDKLVEFNLAGGAGEKARKAAWQYSEGFTDDAGLIAQGFNAEDVKKIKLLGSFSKKLIDDYAEEVRSVGIQFDDLESYVFPQMHNAQLIRQNQEKAREAYTKAFELEGAQNPGAKADAFINDMLEFGSGDPMKSAFNLPKNTDIRDTAMRPLLDHFERDRKITSKEAREAIQDYLIQDVSVILNNHFNKAVPAVEFARIFGARGEGIRAIKRKIHDQFKEASGSTAFTLKEQRKLRNLENAQINEIHKMVNLYFGVHGGTAATASSQLFNHGMAIMSTLANLTYLPKVTISSLGDLVQPFQNSGVWSTMKGGRRTFQNADKDFSKKSGFANMDVLATELRALTLDPLGGSTTTLNTTRRINERFFKLVGLQNLTQYARRFAYNSGIEEGFSVAKKLNKKPTSTTIVAQANPLGITKEKAEYLSKFNKLDDAFDDDTGRTILNQIGIKAADRDALVPQIGNRLAFTQTKDPFVKSFGQFLSWAQAKTTQTNAIVSRIEDGDVALAARMLGALVVYDGILNFRKFLSDPLNEKLDYYDKGTYTEQFLSAEGLLKGATFSAGYTPWAVEKIARLGAATGYGETLPSLSPTLALMNDMSRAGYGAVKNIRQGDPEGAAAQITKVLPLAKEAESVKKVLTGKPFFEDEKYEYIRPNINKGGMISSVIRKKKDKGGIALVPNAPVEPDQRIDKMTGVPYDEQAGEAYTDVEDRQGLIAAVLGKKLQGQNSV